jgi:peptidoglycan hydrolase-like protein with peptidoglycan-binding domain
MNIRHPHKVIPATLAVTALAVGLLAAAPAGAATTVKAAPVASARSASSGYCARYDFWYGDSSHCVTDIQQMLNDQIRLGGYRGSYLSTDGDFGGRTYGQVRNFQARYRLGVDGVVGPVTWRSLCMAAWGLNDSTSYYNAGC